jgi:hypothetical protein
MLWVILNEDGVSWSVRKCLNVNYFNLYYKTFYCESNLYSSICQVSSFNIILLKIHEK